MSGTATSDDTNIIRPKAFMTDLARPGALAGGGPGDGGDDMLDRRVAKLESHVEYIKRDVADLRTDTKQLSKDVGELKADVRMLAERSLHTATTAQVYKMGIALGGFFLAAISGLIGFAPKLWQILGTTP